MMNIWALFYLTAFGSFAILFIIIRAVLSEERVLSSRIFILGRRWPVYIIVVIKIMPALLAALFVVFLRSSNSPFYVLMTLGFCFCFLGDFGMEIKLIIGIGLFTLAQIIFTAGFLYQSGVLGITFPAMVSTVIVIILETAYVTFLYRYLQTSEQGLGRFRLPIILYTIVISAMLSSSVLLWITSGSLWGVLVVFGAIFFVASDSLIGIREFHHRFSKAAISVLSTYYLAILFLSLSILIYQF